MGIDTGPRDTNDQSKDGYTGDAVRQLNESDGKRVPKENAPRSKNPPKGNDKE